jgi:hypothetical protein
MFPLSSPPQHFFLGRHYAPTTPSPLRTGYNVNRQPVMNQDVIKSSPISEGWREGDENWSPAVEKNQEEDVYTPAPQSSIFSRTPASINTSFTTPSTTSKNTTLASAASAQASKFQYEARARSQSPAAQLSRTGSEKKDLRKTKFLDRIRGRREDATDERLLKMQWARERNEWEEDMRRQGKLLDVPEEVETMEDTMEDAEQGGMSPTEEKEIEELAQYYVNEQDASGVNELMDEDDEWDEVFMEVLSQEKQASSQQTVVQWGSVNDSSHRPPGAGGADDMDMS